MDKRMEKQNFIVITGPESTGKTELAQALALELNCQWVPELSRGFIEQLGRPYQISDVETIARLQIQQFQKVLAGNRNFTIFDTGLIITKVWFDVVYQQCPDWLTEAIQKLPKCLHLLCATDIPWAPDPVRENGGKMREKLFDSYKQELEFFGFPYEIIYGLGSERLKNAIRVLKQHQYV
jgi:nicotinamide riboside kinase